MSVGPARRVGTASGAATVALVTRGILDTDTPGGQQAWTRTNHRGEPVSLLAGPAAAMGLLVGGVLGAGSWRGAAAASVATATAATFGVVDDLGEDRAAGTKGLRGHLGALAHGQLTTGGLKVLGIGLGSLVAAAIATPRPAAPARRTGAWVGDVVASGALIAASANLVNLLDLRPGRALKAAALVAAPVAVAPGDGAGLAAGIVGVAAGTLEGDLAERDMLGDGGANALGAALGTAVVLSAPRTVRLTALAVALGLTAASERISFTAVIARTPALRAVDLWGRRPDAVGGRER